jgi:hypothetical protein
MNITKGADAVKADSYIPPADVARNARRALEVRQSKPESQRGMTPVGIARATQLANRRPVSSETIQRMVSYFDRHEVDKQGSTWDEQGKGWQAWYGWGGDEGRAWARRILQSMKENKMEHTDDMAEMTPEQIRMKKFHDVLAMIYDLAGMEMPDIEHDESERPPLSGEAAPDDGGNGNGPGPGDGNGNGPGYHGGKSDDSTKVELTAEERDAMPDNDFAVPSTRNFPVNSPTAVSDAVSGWGRYEGDVSFEEFKRNLIAIAKRKGADYVAALPQSWRDEMENAVKAVARRILGAMD